MRVTEPVPFSDIPYIPGPIDPFAQPASPVGGLQPMPAAIAATALQQAIVGATAQGWRLQSAGPTQAVMINGQTGGTNHVLHLLLSLFTCGLWLIVWLCIVLFTTENPQRSLLITVDAVGNVSYQQGM